MKNNLTFRERRQAGGWLLREIAALAEINISTLHRIETGHTTNPHPKIARAIDAALATKEALAKKEGP